MAVWKELPFLYTFYRPAIEQLCAEGVWLGQCEASEELKKEFGTLKFKTYAIIRSRLTDVDVNFYNEV